MSFKKLILICSLLFSSISTQAQIDESAWGGWYMYFFDAKFTEGSHWGVQGDVQYRNWNTVGDLEQLLLRGGLTYSPEGWAGMFTYGYGNIQTGVYGDSEETSHENRMYQELLMPQKLGWRLFLKHRFRYEQRWVEGQDFRTRYRYNLFLTVPLNDAVVKTKVAYLSFYNELFINGQRDIGDGRTVEIFDRNRSYAALGYAFRDNVKVQFGVMRQTTDSWAKNQIQLSLHHSW